MPDPRLSDPRLPDPSEPTPTLKRTARTAALGLTAPVMAFGCAVNLLLFAGPLYMLQVHDRVLASRSEPTLLVLSLLVLGLTLCLGLLDFARLRVMTVAGARLHAALEPAVLAACLHRAALDPRDPLAATAPQDLDTLRGFAGSPLLLALTDLPWVPLFLAALCLFHPWLGLAALAGAAALAALALLARASLGPALARTAASAARGERLAATTRTEAGTLNALGMAPAACALWRHARTGAQDDAATARATALAAAARTVRLLLQALVIGLGALLVLRDQMSAGAMVAAAILAGRALAPIDTAIAQWPAADRALAAWRRIATLLPSVTLDPGPAIPLPRPQGALEVAGLTLIPPGAPSPVLHDITFHLAPGKALGVIGASGAGKSALARAIVGHWPAPPGSIRLDGADLDQFPAPTLGSTFGYLPQTTCLFDGTVAQNIARLDPSADPAAILAAARAAAAHEMILRLPRGYDTPLAAPGLPLSGGQARRIALARALYGDPPLLILDEPEAHLDAEGAAALGQTLAVLKAQGRAILVISHRPLAIAALDHLLVLDAGRVALHGPRDLVLRRLLNSAPTAPGNHLAEGAA